MPRPTSKDELMALSHKNFQKLNEYIDAFSEEELHREFPEGFLNRNIRDVLAHLHHWHLMMMEWYQAGMQGQKPDIPAKGYTWKTVPDLNRVIWNKYKNVDLQEIRKSFNDSHAVIRQVIESHSDQELFEKKKYKWTGTTSLGAYLISATSSHYDWAYKLIKKCKK